MLLVNDPLLETWKPDFTTSGQPSPVWTRLTFEGQEFRRSTVGGVGGRGLDA